VLRPGFAFKVEETSGRQRKQLLGKSARVIVTMGMPSLLYRQYFRAHSLKNLTRNILHFCGIHPVRLSLIGSIDQPNAAASRGNWLARVHRLGKAGR